MVKKKCRASRFCLFVVVVVVFVVGTTTNNLPGGGCEKKKLGGEASEILELLWLLCLGALIRDLFYGVRRVHIYCGPAFGVC